MMPIKGIKGVKNATEDAAVNFEPEQGNNYRIGYCATTAYKNARVIVKYKDQTLMDKQIDIDPDNYFLDKVPVPDITDPSALYTALYDTEGNLLVDYRPIVKEEKPLPKVIDDAARSKNTRQTKSFTWPDSVSTSSTMPAWIIWNSTTKPCCATRWMHASI